MLPAAAESEQGEAADSADGKRHPTKVGAFDRNAWSHSIGIPGRNRRKPQAAAIGQLTVRPHLVSMPVPTAWKRNGAALAPSSPVPAPGVAPFPEE